MPARVANPMTAQQRKLLVILLKQRGLWDDRHAVCGVESLTLLSSDQAARAIDRLQSDCPSTVAPAISRCPRRPTTGASKRQRSYIRRLWLDCGYAESGLSAFLRQRWHFTLDDDDIEPGLARRAIDSMQQMLRERAEKHGWTVSFDRDGHYLEKCPQPTEVPF